MDNKNINKKAIKCILIGDFSVGKTSILQWQYWYSFKVHQVQIGLDLNTTIVQIEDKRINFQFLEGSSYYIKHIFQSGIYKHVDIFVVVYDITNRETFEGVYQLCQDCSKKSNQDPVFIIVGSKQDLYNERQISYQEGSELAKSLGFAFFEISAKTGYQVEELFEYLIKYMINLDKY
ncbi:hypothetical protein ABPG74_002598 [Tetrahymena malaccensis]